MIICVTQKKLCKDNFFQRIDSIASAKPNAIILREKDCTEKEYLELAKKCYDICKKYDVNLIINTFYNVAKNLNLPVQISFPESQKYSHFPINTGISVHSVEEAIEAEKKEANFLIAGHIFPTLCKPGLPPRGTNFLSEICNNVSCPVLGIGGIDENNALDIAKTGASGFCVMSSLMECPNPYEKTLTLRNISEKFFHYTIK